MWEVWDFGLYRTLLHSESKEEEIKPDAWQDGVRLVSATDWNGFCVNCIANSLDLMEDEGRWVYPSLLQKAKIYIFLAETSKCHYSFLQDEHLKNTVLCRSMNTGERSDSSPRRRPVCNVKTPLVYIKSIPITVPVSKNREMSLMSVHHLFESRHRKGQRRERDERSLSISSF